MKATGDRLAHPRYKILTKSVKKAVEYDQQKGLAEDLGPLSAVKEFWAKAKIIPGLDKTPTPMTNRSDPKRWLSC